MAINSVLMNYIPKAFLLRLAKVSITERRQFLREYLDNQALGIAKILIKAKENTEKHKKQKIAAKDILDIILNEAGFPTTSFITNIAGTTNQILSALSYKAKLNVSDADNVENNLLYQISQLHVFKVGHTLKKIIQNVDNQLAGEQLGKYAKRIDRFDKKGNYLGTDYLNSLYFLFYAEGKQSLKAYLRGEGYNERLINAIANYIEKNAKKYRKNYTRYLRPINQLKKLEKKVEGIYKDFEIDRGWG